MFAEISMALAGPVILAIMGVILAAALAFYFYRTTIPPIPNPVRIILAVLRALSVALLVLFLLEPVIRLINHRIMPPVIAVAIDNSESMSLTDAQGRRPQALRQFLDRTRGSLSLPGTELRYYSFSSSLSAPLASMPDSEVLTGEMTDIGAALSGLKDPVLAENIRAVVLISDGQYNSGRNPVYPAESLRVPVFTVGIGDTTPQKDVLIEHVTTNELVYAGEKVPVDIGIRSTGFDKVPAEVTIREGATVLDHAPVILRADQPITSLRLSIEPKEEGVRRYTVEVSKLPGELTERNNIRSFYLKVLKSKLRIVVIAGAPEPDVASLTGLLAEDPHHQVETVVQKAAQELYSGSLAAGQLDSMDCIVLIDFPTAATSPALLQEIVRAVESKKKPLLFVGGKGIDRSKIGQLEPYLPFTFGAARGTAEEFVSPQIPERARTHSLIAQEGSGSSTPWQKMPPVYRSLVDVKVKPEADLLAGSIVQNIPLPEPLIAVRSIAHQRSVGISGYGIWRWRLMVQGDPATERLLGTFLNNSVRWLTTAEDEKRVRVAPVGEALSSAAPVEFAGQVYDEQLRPLDDAEVTVEVLHGKDQTAAVLSPAGDGRYNGSISGLSEGEYTYRAVARYKGVQVGEDKGRFTVGQLNVEFLETTLNQTLMEQIAFRTGGRYFPAASTDSLASAIRQSSDLTSRDLVRANEIELWHWQYAAGLVILLLAIEWFLRKRYGMI